MGEGREKGDARKEQTGLMEIVLEGLPAIKLKKKSYQKLLKISDGFLGEEGKELL